MASWRTNRDDTPPEGELEAATALRRALDEALRRYQAGRPMCEVVAPLTDDRLPQPLSESSAEMVVWGAIDRPSGGR